MLVSNPRKFTLTLFVYSALLLTLSASASAHIQQRDNANHKRLIKKRFPFPQDLPLPLGPVAGAGAAVPTFPTTSASETTTTESASAASESSSASETSSSASASETSESHSASETSSSAESSTSSTESSTSRVASTTTTSTTTSTSAAIATTASVPHIPTSESLNIVGASTPTSKEVVTLTASVDAEATSAPPKVQSNAAKAAPASIPLTVIIVVASSLAGLTILWTIFRKWKLGSSKKFDERLQPIDWQPTNPDDALPGSHRRLSGASSFRSAGHATRGYDGSDHGHDGPSSYAIPDHDFTAGASLAPVGGYADLARGPSPQPQMNQMSRGPSLTHSAYDVNVPLHHQAGYGTQDAYDYGGSRRY